MDTTNYRFSTLIHSLLNTGGGHTSSSTILEELDNANDSLLLGNVQNRYILLGHSVIHNVRATMDPGPGTDDIRRAYGCGNASKKPDGCIGKFMQGGLASTLSLLPTVAIWVSFNMQYPIPLQLSKWDCDKIEKIVSNHPDQQLANEKIKQHIKVQADADLTDLHPRHLEEIKLLLNNNTEFTQVIENPLQSKFLKITKGEKGNKKFEQLNQDRERIMKTILLFEYNEFIRRGLIIRDINLDTGIVTEFNAMEAKKMHLLGASTIVYQDVNEPHILQTPDFGNIDSNRCHYLEIAYYIKKDSSATVIFLYYHNFNIVMQFKAREQTLTNISLETVNKWVQDNVHLYNKSSGRIYISCLSKQERDEQKRFIGVSSDEFRKIHIYLKHLHGGVRGLSRIDYPSEWPSVALRNFKDIGVAICIDAGNDDIISLSAMKSNIKWENVNNKIIKLLKISLLKIISQYNYNIWKTDEGETNILSSRKKFLQLFGIEEEEEEDEEEEEEEEEEPVSAPVLPIVVPQHIRTVPLNKTQVLERLAQMTEDEKTRKRSTLVSIISKNVNKLETDQLYALVETMLEEIPGNPLIKEGAKL